ncbi:MAG: hypothetical protein C5B59_03510 [Bacteroidetes bacterium]|nr:MAG: hypothetical protein C5B59_03510 [Bacteroidota bacterium]
MKGTFIAVFLLLEFIALSTCLDLCAQDAPTKLEVNKNNFSSFTKQYLNRGKIWMARNKNYISHPDARFGDKYMPNKNAVEIFAKRTIDSKYYINSDTPSIFYIQKSSSPMHFRRNGQWITIDPRLNPKGQSLYEASRQEHPLGFDLKRKSSYIITSEGKTFFNNWKLYGENDGKETLLANADWTNYTVGDDGITIKNIFPGIDADMKVSRGSIKTSFIVRVNKFSNYGTLLFRDSFTGGKPGTFTFSNGLRGKGLASAADYSVGTKKVLHIQQGIMYLEKKPSSAFQNVPYILDHNKLTLSINADYLNTQLTSGNLIIDPLVQDVGTLGKDKINGSHFNNDCSFTKSCNYTVNVPPPAGATLTDALFSFGIVSNAPCTGQDGAFSFAVNGNCMSHLWVGTNQGPGTETFSTQSMMLNNGGSVAGCFPTPGMRNCTNPENIPFNFYFYRTCHGEDGCNGDCIGAAQDLTITLVGRTLDSASIKASNDNFCGGTPVTLTASGYYGVPPYTFNWVGLNQNKGSVQVSPAANTTYSVQISDACGSPPITQSISVHVLPAPPTPALTSNSPVCAGGQLVLSVPQIQGTTYTIKNSANGLGGQYTSSAVFNNVTAAYAGTWTAVATDANGCTSNVASTNVVVNSSISPKVSISATTTRICTGGQVTFTATAANGGNSVNYQWQLNGQNVGTNSPQYTGNNFANNDAVSCIVTANNPCASGSATSNVIVLSVSPQVSPTFAAIGPLCQNSTAPPLPPTSQEGIHGTWNPASINTSRVGTAVYTFTPASGDCSLPIPLSITIVTSVTPTFPNLTDSICQNSTAPQLPGTSAEGITGTWNPSSISTSNVGKSTYTFTPTDGQCGVPAKIDIVVGPPPELNMGPDLNITVGTSTHLDITVTGDIVSYQWSPSIGLSDPTIKDPIASPTITTVYTLNVTDANHCEASGKIKITVSGGASKISIPNAFSPNGDGVNDTWVITNLSNFPGATVDVFNRYGQAVFHSENNNKAWDGTYNGKPVPMGTYYYIIDLKDNEKKIAGSVTVFK